MFSAGTLMIEFRQLFWILTLSTFLLMTTGCTTNRWIPINEELEREGSGLQKESGQAITAFQLQDGIEKEFEGRVKLAAQDSLIFWEKEYVAAHYESGDYVQRTVDWVPGPRFTLNAVKALNVQMGSPEKTIPLVIFVSAGLIALVASAVALSSLQGSFN